MTASSDHTVRNAIQDLKGWIAAMAKNHDLTVAEARKGLQYLDRLETCYQCLLEQEICPIKRFWGKLRRI